MVEGSLPSLPQAQPPSPAWRRPRAATHPSPRSSGGLLLCACASARPCTRSLHRNPRREPMEVQQQHTQLDLNGTTMGFLVTVVALF
ncbi:hypothetical protein BDA96_10G194300 [Sorghum bicolor]|uniref:Uncharacterized protein n=1 Tax=Sorghum bicolor TaxID=4558 RepID=A0A921Q2X1_SORBI|nr:hypothetical protein BDA96_10G194200 [Sorghum bicolor]KAG0514469.1 hypothetical protein BDA96_10G194300 [Sorghum bicolor]